jgi:hypothetical protein
MTIRRSTGLIGGSFTGESVRPSGYAFPTGLTPAPFGGNVVVYFGATETWTVPTGVTSVDYLVVAGGGGGAEI